MRILAIRGANLASLTAFEMDLTTDPLSGAGLFAITGDTGAGKSTILDALCLALYGEYPRATGARGEKDIDASGDSVSVKDARNILRRGAASGFAEADFIGRDGVAYRARWETRRAKQKSSGKLQPVDRSLNRLDASATIATGVSDVEAAVIDRTGLTFDQFRRTVLLAQGEFDAFLLADERSRADLLEKITGTEVYSRISQAIHAAAQSHADKIAHLETARGAVALLEPEVRVELDKSVHDAEGKVAGQSTELQRLVSQRAKVARRHEALANLAVAEKALEAAKAADAAADGDRKKLIVLGRMAPISAKANENRAAIEAVKAAKEARTKADADMRAAQTLMSTAAMDLQKSMASETTAMTAFAALEPLWREAEAIDVELNTARRELLDARAAAEASQKDGVAAKATVEKLSTDRIALKQALDRLNAELEQSSTDATLAERGREISKLLMKRHDASVTANNELHEVDHSQTIVTKLVEDQTREHRTVIEATERRASISDKLKTLRAQLQSSDVGGIEEQDRALSLLLEKTREAEAIAHAWRQADVDIVEARETIVASKQALERAEEQRASAESDLNRRSDVRRELGTFAVLADATLTDAAEQLRDSLANGQPCPVCGSKAHPFVSHDGSGSKLAREIAGRRDSIDAEIDGLQRHLNDCTESAAAARAQIDEAQRRATQAHSEKSRLAQTYATLAKPLTAAITACRLSFLVPAALDTRTGQALAQIAGSATRARAQFEQTIKRRTDLRSEIDSLQQEHEDLARQREAADERHKGHSAERINVERRLAAAESRATDVLRTLEDLNTQLSPYLLSIGVTADDLDADTETIENQLNERGALYQARRAERDRIAGRLQAFAIEEAGAKAVVDGADEKQRTAAATATQREARVAELTAKRAALLNGEATDEHRKLATAARDQAQAARTASAEAQQKTALDLAISMVRQQAAIEAVAAADTLSETTRQALAAAVGEIGIAWSEVEVLMALPADTMIVLGEKTAALARAVTDAEKACDVRRSDLEALDADGIVDADLTLLDAKVATLGTEIAAFRDAAAAARTKLSLDAEARAKVGSIADEIDAAKQTYAVWQAVDAAVGSSNGDKFRRYAQGVTLDHLTALANIQLEALNPRYRLARSKTSDLGLSIIDRDMGEELRAVRSLSGGERFLVSLALALALSGLEGKESFVDTLFIDEGFGALDADTLDTAIDALEMLHSQGRKVGVITHVAAMIERIAVQIRVEKRGQGRSTVRMAA